MSVLFLCNCRYRSRKWTTTRTWDEDGTVQKWPKMHFCTSLMTRKSSKTFKNALHSAFAVKRIRGEWFDLSSQDVAQIMDATGDVLELLIIGRACGIMEENC